MRAEIVSIVQELKNLRTEGTDSLYMREETLTHLESALTTRYGDLTPNPRSESAGTGKASQTPAPTPKVRPGPPAKTPSATAEPPPNLMAEWKEVSVPAGDAVSPPTPSNTSQSKGPADSSKDIPDWVAPIPDPTPFSLPEGTKEAQWRWLRDKVMEDPVCNQHLRSEGGKKLVFGTGNLNADLFFCGEAPGADEETQGEPFVGKAGQLLDKIIAAMGLKREATYISNILNWRPEHDMPNGNRPPSKSEIAYCLPFVKAQVEIVQPKVIIALGATAAHGLLGHDPKRTVSRTRGQWLSFQGTPLVLTYHPAYLLRQNTNKSKRVVWEDMLRVMEKTGIPISEKQRAFFL